MTEDFVDYRGVLKKNYNLAHLSWLKTGGAAQFFYKPADLADLQNFLQQIPPLIPLTTIGAGSNILIRDVGIEGVSLKLGSCFNYIQQEDDFLNVGAATLNYSVATFCLERGLTGAEFLSGIPGTIGGGIAMNAGAYGREFKDIIYCVSAVDKSGKLRELSLKDMGFGYRCNNAGELVFVGAKLKLNKGCASQIKDLMHKISVTRLATQPIKQQTAGSTFANPPGYKAWQLIEQVGLKGYILNQAQFSPLHCNFLINLGGAKASDLENLGELARTKVLAQTGIDLQWEVKRLGQKI